MIRPADMPRRIATTHAQGGGGGGGGGAGKQCMRQTMHNLECVPALRGISSDNSIVRQEWNAVEVAGAEKDSMHRICCAAVSKYRPPIRLQLHQARPLVDVAPWSCSWLGSCIPLPSPLTQQHLRIVFSVRATAPQSCIPMNASSPAKLLRVNEVQSWTWASHHTRSPARVMC